MRYHALAADYDGTLAHHGVIDEETWAALRKFRESGRKLVMVTGRELDDLLRHIPNHHAEVFDRIVAENGALIYEPATKETRILAEPPPPSFAEELKRRGVDRISVGRCIVATWEPHEDVVFHVIHDLGLELSVIFNKGAVMILPTGVNKATGLVAALHELGLSCHNVVAIGDAENDHALLSMCECGVAVSNALPALKDKADILTRGDHGRGVAELIEHVLHDDLAFAASRLTRHRILVGRGDEREVSIDPYGTNMMICGTSGSGKSTITTGILERLCARHYQFAIVDPEGDFTTFNKAAVVLGGSDRPPLLEEVLDVLRGPDDNLVINLLGVSLDHRPEFFLKLTPALGDLRARTGRPHWLVIDEAHHMMPASRTPAEGISFRPHGTIYITVHPGSVASPILDTIDTLLVLGTDPDATVREFCEARGVPRPKPSKQAKLPTGEALYWRVGAKHAEIIKTELPKGERKRHSRKYSEGNLGERRSFYFKGRDNKLNLKAHNLLLFVQMAAGVDDDTWNFHLDNHDYSRWLRTEVKDPVLADEVERIELEKLPPAESRVAVHRAIENRYTLPADKPSGVVDKTGAELLAAAGR